MILLLSSYQTGVWGVLGKVAALGSSRAPLGRGPGVSRLSLPSPSCRSLDPPPQRSRSAIVMRRTRRIVDQWRIRCTLNFLTVYGFQWTLYSTISSVGTFSQGKRHSYAKATSPMSLAKVSDLLIARWWRDPLAIRVPVGRM